MTREVQDKLWNELSKEQKTEYSKEFQQESESYDINLKHCDEENGFEYRTGYSNGVITTLEDLFGSHNLNPKPLTYTDVVKELFKNGAWQVAGREYSRDFGFNEDANDHYILNCASEEQGQKLLAINKLLNVAKYLNGDWKPDWKDDNQVKWFIELIGDGIDIDYAIDYNSRIVYFRTSELAEQAVQILGEEVIRLALSTDY